MKMNSGFKKISSPKIWVLIDNRTGNTNQSLALASKLCNSYEVKKIKYNILGVLPNFLLRFWPIYVSKALVIALKNQAAPDIIISSGRRIAPLALYLKRNLENKKVKIVQIMHPNLNLKEFDLIILPHHDYCNNVLPNIVRVIGALNNVQKLLPEAKSLLKINYPEIKKFITVIVGGSNKKYSFDTTDAELLSNITRSISKNHSLPLFITFSRRTPRQVKAIFKKNFFWPNIFWDPEKNLLNPYPGIIGEGEYTITTADSISMCSEAASTGKPVYIFCPKSFKLKKHKIFIQQLIDLGTVKMLDDNTTFLKKYNYVPLHEIDKVVAIIKKKLIDL